MQDIVQMTTDQKVEKIQLDLDTIQTRFGRLLADFNTVQGKLKQRITKLEKQLKFDSAMSDHLDKQSSTSIVLEKHNSPCDEDMNPSSSQTKFRTSLQSASVHSMVSSNCETESLGARHSTSHHTGKDIFKCSSVHSMADSTEVT